jgi:hypothetical protein
LIFPTTSKTAKFGKKTQGILGVKKLACGPNYERSACILMKVI